MALNVPLFLTGNITEEMSFSDEKIHLFIIQVSFCNFVIIQSVFNLVVY